MGISELWDVLKPGFGERIQFEEFVVHFVEENSRTPRVAIDAYIWIFQSTHSEINVEDESSTIIRNFMAKLLYLTSLNVSYVVVFDGAFKPGKIRGEYGGSDSGDYEKELNIFHSANRRQYSNNSILIEKIILQLKLYKIDFVQAPGEGEAECAQLQRIGIVDFVLSGDVDSLVFGATKILRNFSKYIDDTASPSKKNNDVSLKYFVTPIDINDIIKKTGLDRKRLVLLASFRGGDYSSGIRRIGIKNATRLAQCGTSFSNDTEKMNADDPIPDFSEVFHKCFVKDVSKSAFGYKEMNSKQIRQEKLSKFMSLLRETINLRSKDIFKRSLTLKDEIFINEYYTLLYLFPIVSEKLFMFIPGALSYGEKFDLNSNLKLLNNNLNIQDGSIENVHRINNLVSIDSDIGVSTIKYSSHNGIVDIADERFTSYIQSYISPCSFQNFNYPLKYIIIKLLFESYFQEYKLQDKIILNREKVEKGITFVMVKYDVSLIKRLISNENANGEEIISDTSPSKLDYIYTPKKIIDLVNPKLVREFDVSMKLKRMGSSPKRKVPTQKTTLDFFGQFPKSPTKKVNVIKTSLSDSSKPSLLMKSPFNSAHSSRSIYSAQKEYPKNESPKKKSPKKDSPRRNSPRKALLPGQKSVDYFFNKDKDDEEENPFLEKKSESLLFAPEEQKEPKKEGPGKSYSHARDSFNSIPKLKLNSPSRGIKRALFSYPNSDKRQKASPILLGSPSGLGNEGDRSVVAIDSEVSDTSSIQEIDAITFEKKT